MPLIASLSKPFKRQTLSLYSENGWFFQGKTWHKTKHCSCKSFKRSSANAKIDNATVNYNIGGGTPNGPQIKLFHFIHCSPHNSVRLHGSRAIYTKCARLNTTVLVILYEFDHSSYQGMTNQQSGVRSLNFRSLFSRSEAHNSCKIANCVESSSSGKRGR